MSFVNLDIRDFISEGQDAKKAENLYTRVQGGIRKRDKESS